MAMFKAFKPEAMNKIAKAMGYSGDMGQFQSYIEQDPMRQQQMQRYTNAAIQMARGGVVRMQAGGSVADLEKQYADAQRQRKDYITRKLNFTRDLAGSDYTEARRIFEKRHGQAPFSIDAINSLSKRLDAARKAAATPPPAPVPAVTPEGPLGGGGFEQNFQSAPMYDQFKQSDYYKNMPMIGAMVTGSATIDGQNYNFPMAMQADAYQDYMRSLGGYQVGPREQAPPPVLPQMPIKPPQMDQSQPPDYFLPAINPPLPPGATERRMEVNPKYTGGKENVFENVPIGDSKLARDARPQAPGGEMGPVFDSPETPPAQQSSNASNITEAAIQRMYQPGLPAGGVTQASMTPSEAGQYIQPGVGTLTGAVAVPTAMAAASQAAPVQETAAAQMQATQAAPAINAALQATQAAQTTVDPRAEVIAAQQTASSVGDVQAAQGNAILINNPVQRQIQQGEMISGNAVDATKVQQATAQIQAAQATPSTQATVQGQLANLTANFDAANPPAWAAGSLRAATQTMAQRGLGASSLAGQAIVQAALEAALPIAQADARTVAGFEAQNLTNRQQAAMLAAEQRAKFLDLEFNQEFQSRVQNAARVADIANMNFTAEQQVALENSRIANTMNLNNLSNSQAMVMSEAAALAQMDQSNLNNRQQAAVQNAQSFLQVDMANMSNRQQTDLFKSQQRVQSLFTDQAAQNAAAQFNATSQNQVDQFFAGLAAQVGQFNATQINAQAQFNSGQANTVERFNAELNNQRDQFNAQNQLAIAQNNAVWRRQIATADTAAVNRVNELNANAVLAISNQAYSNLWNYYADTMEWAWTSAENQVDRNNALAIAELDAGTRKEVASEASSSAAGNALGSLIGTLGSAFIMCWVAREVYGARNVEWFIFRTWMQYDAPRWLFKLYQKHGKSFAKFISNKPMLKSTVKFGMDTVVNRKKRKHNVSCAY